jgi:hypothetical protein
MRQLRHKVYTHIDIDARTYAYQEVSKVNLVP